MKLKPYITISNFLKTVFLLFSLNAFSQKEETLARYPVDPIEDLDPNDDGGNGGNDDNGGNDYTPTPIRYKDNIYSPSQIVPQYNLYYGSYALANHHLFLDYYSSANPLPNRPAVFLLYGGGFTNGYKYQMLTTAYRFANKGYAVFAIDYRLLGSTNLTETGGINYNVICNNGQFNDMAWYWAMQDLNAAIKAIAFNKNSFKIDPNKIFLYGESAGAISALQLTYTTQQEVYDTFPSVNFNNYPFLGNLDNTTYPPAKSQTYTILGVASVAGALTRGHYLASNETTPAVMLHSPCDTLVPYDDDENGLGAIFNFPCQGTFYGSRYIYDEMESWNTAPAHKLYIDCGKNTENDHDLDVGVITNFTEYKVPAFFYDILYNNSQSSGIEPLGATTYCNDNDDFWCNGSSGNRIAENSKENQRQQDNFEALVEKMSSETKTEIIVHPNPTKGTASLNLGLWQGESITVNLFEPKGSLISSNIVTVKNSNQKHTIDLLNVTQGIYFIKIESSKGTQVSKLIKQ